LSIDVIGRRRVVEERLRRARNLTKALDQATAEFASGSGRPMEDLDPEGSLRTAVTTLAGVAALRPGFDILVSLPDSPFALRLRHLTDDVNIELVRHPTDAPGPNTPDPSEPTAPGLPDSGRPAQPEGHVASDLAAMLWQDVGPPPH
jgi:hypothetical protein